MGTLIYWCKEDNLEKYKQIHSKYNKDIVANSTLYKLLYKSAGAAHTDLANVIYRYFNGFGLSEENRFIVIILLKNFGVSLNLVCIVGLKILKKMPVIV